MIASGAQRNESKCVLLTGATGFLGQYLLRDLIVRNVPVIAVARKKKGQSGQDRVHRVVRIWEDVLGQTLARPQVIEWEVDRPPESCLTKSQIQWLRDNVDTILHSAASVRFEWDRQRVEPFRSNVEGTKHLIQLATRIGNVHVHHVSTAYVCGDRDGVVREERLESARFRNPYEESKAMAEKLLFDSRRQFGSLTIYRPSVIVGDSTTGFASHFQTIYAGLRLVSLSKTNSANSIDSFFSRFGIQGHEAKNLIPVDVVSDAILRLLTPEHRDRIYHLTASQPLSIAEIAQAMKQAIELDPDAWSRTENFSDASLSAATDSFLASYRSYFVDDATFDRTHTLNAIPDASNWRVTPEQLVRMFGFAIREKFQEAESKSEATIANLLRSLQRSFRSAISSNENLHASGNSASDSKNGIDDLSIFAKPWVILAIQRGELTVKEAMQTGSLVVVGPTKEFYRDELILDRLHQMTVSPRQSKDVLTNSPVFRSPA